MPLLTRESFLCNGSPLPFEDVPVPEISSDACVRISVMSGALRDVWDLSLAKHKDDLRGVRALLVSMTAVDESGAPLFTEADAAAIDQKNGIVLERLYRVAWRLNKLGRDELEAAAKN